MRKLILTLLIIVSLFFASNIPVSTRQGVNYQVQTLRIPLYLKLLNFFDRYFNYRELTNKIVKDANSEEEKVMRIFTWTHNNIRKAPQGLPVVDDHSWYTIVRGYGVHDQSQDVFTTLCNIAGIEAFFSTVYTDDKTGAISLSFVKLRGKWYVLDAYRGVYFQDSQGRLADIGAKNGWLIAGLDGQPDIDYTPYLKNLPTIKEIGLNRSNTQSPLNRLLYEIKKKMR